MSRLSRSHNEDTFLHFVVDQLAMIPDLRWKRMFGGTGLYSGGNFFAIVYGGRLYFRTSDRTRSRYESAGTSCFQPNARQSLRQYYEVPPHVIEDRDELVRWASEAAASIPQA